MVRDINIYRFVGEGTLSILDNIDSQVNVKILFEFYLNTQISIVIESQNFIEFNQRILEPLNQDSMTKLHFAGSLRGNLKIEIPLFYIDKFTTKLDANPKVILHGTSYNEIFVWDSDYNNYQELLETKGEIKVGFANFVFGGRDITSYPDGSSRRDSFGVTISNISVDFKKLKHIDQIVEELKGENNVYLTSHATTKNHSCSDLKEFFDNLCWLLSYSQKTLINKCYSILNDGRKNILIVFHNKSYYGFSGALFVDSKQINNNDLAEFIESTFDNFCIYREKIKLVEIIDIICQAELAKVLQTKYLLLSSALELLVEEFRHLNNIEVDEDQDVINTTLNCIKKYAKRNGLEISADHIANLSSKLAYKTLKKKIAAVVNYAKFDYSEKDISRIKNNRNKIVHEVRFVDDDILKGLADYDLIKLLIDRILIRILGFSGYVCNSANKYEREKII